MKTRTIKNLMVTTGVLLGITYILENYKKNKERQQETRQANEMMSPKTYIPIHQISKDILTAKPKAQQLYSEIKEVEIPVELDLYTLPKRTYYSLNFGKQKTKIPKTEM